MADLVPSGGTIVAQEQSSSVASSSSEARREVGNTKILERSSEFASEEISKLVQESSSSISSSSSRIVSSSSSSVSSSVSTQKVSSTSIGIGSSSQENALDANGNQVAEDISLTSLVPTDSKPVTQVFESESSQEYFVKAEDGKIIQEQSSSSHQESVTGNSQPSEQLPLPQQPSEPPPGLEPLITVQPEPVAPESTEPPKKPPEQEQPPQQDVVVNGSNSTEIHQESIKNTLKEIISEVEEALVSEIISDSSTTTTQPIMQESLNSEETKINYNKQTSTTTLEETTVNSKEQCPLLPSYLFEPGKRPLSLPPQNLLHLWHSLKIAQELNQVLGNLKETTNGETQDVVTNGNATDNEQDDSKPSDGLYQRKPIDLEKLFTPASDSGEVTPSRNRKMFASSSFYKPSLHPTVEDQVELARRISRSLSDVSNQQSKGQSMYVNRKNISVKWVHEGPGIAEGERRESDAQETSGDDKFKDTKFQDKNKPVLKLIMDPRGQIQDLNSLRKQGYTIEPGSASPEIVFDLVRDLNAPKGKGAELFAKRRKRSEKWVVDETNVKSASSLVSTTTTELIQSSTTQQQQSVGGKAPPIPTYTEKSTKRAEVVQKLNEIQERFTQPRLRMVKSPWEAALQTGSVDTAFQEFPPLNPRGFVAAPTSDVFDSLYNLPQTQPGPTWTSTTTPVTNNSFNFQPQAPAPAPAPAPPAAFAPAPAPSYAPPPVPSYAPPPAPSYAPPPAPSYAPPPIKTQSLTYQQRISESERENIYKPRVPRGWNTDTIQQQTQDVPPATPMAPSYTALQQPAPSAAPDVNQASLATSKNLYANLSNYNTAARGWGSGFDYYRPVTFNPSKLAYTT